MKVRSGDRRERQNCDSLTEVWPSIGHTIDIEYGIQPTPTMVNYVYDE